MNAELLMKQDALSRQKIVEEIHSNFFVEAGAGSGKTTILVKRMVAMVEQGLDVDKICAITFTKAAAGEFYDRFQKLLIQRSTAPTVENFARQPGELGNPTDLTRERCLQALNNIDLCFMGTIDGFCNMILSEHPAKAGIPSNAALLSQEDMMAHYKRVYSQIQNGEHGTNLQQLCRRFRAFYVQPDSTFTEAIPSLMALRNCAFIFDTLPAENLDRLLQDEKAALLPVLQTLYDHPELKYENAKTDGSAWEALRTKKNLLFSDWHDNICHVIPVLKKISHIRLLPETDLSLFGAAGARFFAPHISRGKLANYIFSDDTLVALLDRLKAIQYSATMEFLTAATEKIAEVLRKEGKLDFFDYILYLRDTLRTDAAAEGRLIRHIYDRHQYFLIDEFQDTNPIQAEIFFYLTAQIPQVDWRKCIPHPGSLFIVGDPKQSIYRFRHADVSAFLRIREMFTGEVGEVVCLTRNFRSTHKLRSWFNRVFEELLPETTPLQSRYAPIPLEAAPAADGTFDGIYSYTVATDASAPPEEKDPEKVAKIISRIVNNPAYTIPQPDGAPPRRVTYQDIMLITPAKKRMGNYLRIFARQGIPFRIEGKVLFSQCPSLVAVSRIFTAVANPHSVQALIGALQCKRFGFDLNALHRIKNEGYSLSLFKALPEGAPFSDAISRLRQLVARSHQLSAASLFSWILEDLQIFRYVGAKNLEYVYFALELLRSAEGSGLFSSLSQAAQYLETLITDATEAERTISLTQNEDRVHIANLHKVKGLEAPVVILADPQWHKRPPSVRVEQHADRPQCWIFHVGNNNIQFFSCVGWDDRKDLEKACMEAERDRLLYVAATRAKRVLIIADAQNAKGISSQSSPWKFFVDRCEGDFFEMLPVGTVAAAPIKKPVKWQDLYGSAENLLHTTASGDSSYAIRRPSQIKLKGKTSAEDDFEDIQTESVRTHTVRDNAAVIGTLVHSLMEVMVSSRNSTTLHTLVREIASEYEAESETYIQMLTKVGTAIQSGGFPQENGAPEDILSALLGADEVYCEVPFCRKDGNDLWHGIMDVVYRIGEQWFILDYKTNADAHDLDIKYQEQLAAYVEAFYDLTGQRAIPLIYHIDV